MKQPEPIEPRLEEKPDIAAETVIAENEQPVMEENPDPVAFLDRLIAFFILIGPFSFLVSYAQELLADYVPTTVNNMMVLAGIIGFLLAVGYLSRKIHAFREARKG